MGNCLVTRLKGVVDNSSLKYLGEFDVVLNTAGGQNYFAILDSGINWKSNNPIVEEGTGVSATSGTTTGLSSYRATVNNTTVKVYSKYNVTGIRVNADVSLDLADIAGYNDNPISIMFSSQKVFSSVPIKRNIVMLGNAQWNTQLPILGSASDYDKLSVGSGYTTGKLSLNLTNANSNFVDEFDIVSIVGHNYDNMIAQISVDPSVSSKCIVSDIEEISNLENLSTIAISGVSIKNGSVVTALQNLTKLGNVGISNIESGQREELKDLFDAWKTNGRVSSSCHFYVGGAMTYNGTAVTRLDVTFDSNGNYTVTNVG